MCAGKREKCTHRDSSQPTFLKNIEKRLYDIKEVKAHPWFKGLDWDAVYRRRLRPPWVPTGKNGDALKKGDRSNFDKYKVDEKKAKTLDPVTDAMFAEF